MKERPVDAVIDTGSWLSLITTRRAQELGVKAERRAPGVALCGIGKGTARRSEAVRVLIDGRPFDIVFWLVEEFPFDVCIGLKDTMEIAKTAGSMKRLLIRPYPALGVVEGKKDHASGVNEAASDEELLAAGKETLLRRGGKDLDPAVFDQVWALFQRFSRCWLRPRSGRFTGPPAVIEPVAAPVKGKRRPLSPAMKEQVAGMISSQLRAGVIEPSKSDWSSPIHVVTKKDGSYRMVIDYREVNKRIKSDTYPIPLISEILQESSGHKFYITLDLCWGFWNLGLEERSRAIAAFVTHLGTFQPCVLPFGMKNSPSEFQRAVDFAFGSLYSGNVKIYIDDIVLYANTIPEILSLLESVLSKACEFGLFLKLEKCEIFPEEASVLGHKVGSHGFRADPARIEALKRVAYPRDKKLLRSFVSACSYLRDFIPSFSDLVAPFRPLLKKDSSWAWTDEHRAAHDELLDNLSDAVILNGPRGCGPFVLICDASSYAVGGCLLQQQGEIFAPMGFFSRSLSLTEQRWDTREREMFAIKWGLERNRDLVKGHKVFVLTDHSSLQWVAEAPQAKVQRWALYMGQFDIVVLHIAGKLNVIADWMSRNNVHAPDHDEVIEQICVPVACSQPEQDRLRLPTVAQLTAAIEETPHEERRQCTKGADGLLYGARSKKLYVPKEFRLALLYWFHAGPYGCHRGVNATTRQMKKYVWWPQIGRSVQSFVKRCLPCARNRSPKRATASMVLRRPSPFELVSVDFVGPRIFGAGSWYYACIIDHCSRFVVTVASGFPPTAAEAVAALQKHWVPIFGAPAAVLTDNGSQFDSRAFRDYVTKELKSHHVFSSPYYPAGNGINEASHRVLEHGIKCAVQLGTTRTFPDLLMHVTLAYNASYHSAVKDSPFALLFGKPPVLPGLQGLMAVEPEDQRLSRHHYRRARELLIPFQVSPDEASPVAEGRVVKVGDFVIYPLSDYEKGNAVQASSCLSYSPDWSLPCRVQQVKDKQLVVAEYGTNRNRRVPQSQVKLVPQDLPPGLAELNWSHIQHHLPLRWSEPLDSSKRPYYATTTAPLPGGSDPLPNPTDAVRGTLPATSPPTTAKRRRNVKPEER